MSVNLFGGINLPRRNSVSISERIDSIKISTRFAVVSSANSSDKETEGKQQLCQHIVCNVDFIFFFFFNKSEVKFFCMLQTNIWKTKTLFKDTLHLVMSCSLFKEQS